MSWWNVEIVGARSLLSMWLYESYNINIRPTRSCVILVPFSVDNFEGRWEWIEAFMPKDEGDSHQN